MSSKKVISISPELLKPGTSASNAGKPKTRRGRKKKPIQKELRSGTLKKALLKKIKEHQKKTGDQNEKKELVRGREKGSDNVSLLMKEKAKPKEEYSESSFNASMKYLNELSHKQKKQRNSLKQMKKDRKAQRKMERKQRKMTNKRRPHTPRAPPPQVHKPELPPTPIQDVNPQVVQMQPTAPTNMAVQVYAPPSPIIQPKLIDSNEMLQLKPRTNAPPGVVGHNKTLKNNVQIHSKIPDDFSNTTVSTQPAQTISVYPNEIPQAPPYSNLKNGTKPSFKQWKKTLKNSDLAGGDSNEKSKVKIHIDEPGDKFNKPQTKREKNLEKLKTKFQDDYDVLTDFKDEKEAMIEEMKRKERRPFKKKITRTIKRIHKLGKKDGVVGVLIKDNKTRKRAHDEYKEICKRPIKEVKDYLREHELLKVGSPAPTDVLRAMYENSVLAGDVHNKNSDVLVHNYMSSE